MVADIQPQFVPSDANSLNLEKRLGTRRTTSSYAWKTLISLGVATCGGSDSPIEKLSALTGIYCAITRQSPEGIPAGGWRPEENLTADEAVRLYTYGGAYAAHWENKMGAISAGMLADFVILDRDILTCQPDDILRANVVATAVNGEIVRS